MKKAMQIVVLAAIIPLLILALWAGWVTYHSVIAFLDQQKRTSVRVTNLEQQLNVIVQELEQGTSTVRDTL